MRVSSRTPDPSHPFESRGNICSSAYDRPRFAISAFHACPRCGGPVLDPRRGCGAAADRPADALPICLLLCGSERDSYERAAVRWLGRYCLERPAVTLEDVRRAVAAFERLPRDPARATRELEALGCAAHDEAPVAATPPPGTRTLREPRIGVPSLFMARERRSEGGWLERRGAKKEKKAQKRAERASFQRREEAAAAERRVKGDEPGQMH
jgi:hypothetical protein